MTDAPRLTPTERALRAVLNVTRNERALVQIIGSRMTDEQLGAAVRRAAYERAGEVEQVV